VATGEGLTVEGADHPGRKSGGSVKNGDDNDRNDGKNGKIAVRPAGVDNLHSVFENTFFSDFKKT